ncbi:MAG TPA: hypothetical protein VGC99_11930 [Candidatus Tectomicrobia bacterium]
MEWARATTEAQLDAANVLLTAYLRVVFNGSGAQQWPRKQIGELARVQSGYAFKREWFAGEGVRLLRNANVFQGYIAWNAACVTVVFRAQSQSSLSAAEQMRWAVEAELDDEYDLCQAVDEFWEHEPATADWHMLPEKLTHRLRHFTSIPGEETFSRNYRLTNWLIYALEQDRPQLS